jgi:hypothetical protein
MTDTAAFDPALADGTREQVRTIGVDAGTMCLAAQGGFPQNDEWMSGGLDRAAGPGWSGRGWACSTSGYGDGVYDTVRVVRDGTAVGVEVVFLFPAADAAAEDAMHASGLTEPEQAQWDAFYGPDKADPGGQCGAWRAAQDKALNDAYDRLLPTASPADRSVPHVVADLTVPDGRVLVGDPCYDGPTAVVEVPSGTYRVVAWQTDAGPWGERTARLGAYRLPDQPA